MGNTVRILHILGSMKIGGAQTLIMNIYRNIDREKIQFDFLLSEDGDYDEEIKSLGGKIYKTDYLTKVGPLKYKRELKKFFETHKEYNIIHSHLNQVTGLVLKVAYKCKIPIKIAHCHTTKNLNNIFIKIYKKYLQSKINKYSDYRLACSREAGEWLYKKANFEIINNGIDVEKFKYNEKIRNKIRKALNIDENTIVLGHVGRFSKVKNHTFLIEIFNEYYNNINKNSKLVLIGDGELKNQIIEKVQKLKLENQVIFINTTDKIHEYYNAMDLFTFPSLYEGVPVSLVEAQTARLKCFVSSNITKEICLTPLIKYLPIDKGISVWVDEISNSNNERIDFSQNIKLAGFDINKTVEVISRIYSI